MAVAEHSRRADTPSGARRSLGANTDALEQRSGDHQQMRLFVVDDHAGFRSAARDVLEVSPWTVVGEHTGACGLSAAVTESGAEVALIDVDLGEADGFEVVADLALSHPALRCVLISTRSQSDYRRRLQDSSAIGFIDKAELSCSRLAEVLAAETQL